jgi:hypothetical protein
MSPFAEFYHVLLREGRAVLNGPLQPEPADLAETTDVLRQAYGDYQLDLAGPRLEFDAKIGLAAAAVVYHACLALVSHALPVSELEKLVVMPGPPVSPAAHLSADLVLRFLPSVHRRARALAPADPLAGLLETLLRQWPLSGALADITEEPMTPLDFGGHPGLLFLYAERLARHEKPAWLPTGACLDYVELVWAELGKDVTLLRQSAATGEKVR